MKTNDINSKLRAYLPAALWFVLIIVLLSLPGSSFPVIRIWQPDKIAHILLFGGQHALLWLALELPTSRFSTHNRSLAISFSITVLFGILSEVYQDIATSRLMDLYDIIANVIGVALSCIIIIGIGSTKVLAFARRMLRL